MTNFNLKNKSLLLIKILFIYSIFFTESFATESDNLKNITEGDKNAKI